MTDIHTAHAQCTNWLLQAKHSMLNEMASYTRSSPDKTTYRWYAKHNIPQINGNTIT